jgi:hypothetical protein
VNGQIFNEIENDDNYNIIKKLYKTTFGNKRFYAFKFMSNSNLNNYSCVYDTTIEPVNITISIDIDRSYNVKQILNSIKNELEKIS